jgi:hypothetical protein
MCSSAADSEHGTSSGSRSSSGLSQSLMLLYGSHSRAGFQSACALPLLAKCFCCDACASHLAFHILLHVCQTPACDVHARVGNMQCYHRAVWSALQTQSCHSYGCSSQRCITNLSLSSVHCTACACLFPLLSRCLSARCLSVCRAAVPGCADVLSQRVLTTACRTTKRAAGPRLCPGTSPLTLPPAAALSSLASGNFWGS